MRPEIDAPETFRFAIEEANDLANTHWWQQFHDPTLDELITIALSDNFDVRIAAARVDEFYGTLGITRSGKFPQVGAEAAVGTGRTPPAAAADSVRVNAFASWEIDLFGRLRRLTEASRADLLASEEGRRFAVLTLVSAVAETYITLLGVDAQLDIARRTLISREEALKIFEARYRRGATSEFQLSQSRSEYAVTQVNDSAARTSPGADRKRAVVAARAQSGAHDAQQLARGTRTAESTVRPAFGDPRAPAGHQAGRAQSHLRECAHRRGESAVLPEHFPDRAVRHREQLVRHPVHRTRRALQLRRRASPDRSSRAAASPAR